MARRWEGLPKRCEPPLALQHSDLFRFATRTSGRAGRKFNRCGAESGADRLSVLRSRPGERRRRTQLLQQVSGFRERRAGLARVGAYARPVNLTTDPCWPLALSPLTSDFWPLTSDHSAISAFACSP